MKMRFRLSVLNDISLSIELISKSDRLSSFYARNIVVIFTVQQSLGLLFN
jgi:hypothetical protein